MFVLCVHELTEACPREGAEVDRGQRFGERREARSVVLDRGLESRHELGLR